LETKALGGPKDAFLTMYGRETWSRLLNRQIAIDPREGTKKAGIGRELESEKKGIKPLSNLEEGEGNRRDGCQWGSREGRKRKNYSRRIEKRPLRWAWKKRRWGGKRPPYTSRERKGSLVKRKS